MSSFRRVATTAARRVALVRNPASVVWASTGSENPSQQKYRHQQLVQQGHHHHHQRFFAAVCDRSALLPNSGCSAPTQQQLNHRHHQVYFSSSSSTTSGEGGGSDESHDDFAPKYKISKDANDDVTAAKELIAKHVAENPVMLYMKGNPSMPMCGFSARVVQILKNEDVDFGSVNVLDYPTIRQAIKEYSNWPTIPQLYVNGEFMGGCDIVTSMHESGELADVLKDIKQH